MINLPEFKRMNFFTGFFTTANDWEEGQSYHIDKRKLHNRSLHTPGIMRGERDELSIQAIAGLRYRVLPGSALDANGNEIYLGSARELELKPGELSLPRVVYIAIRYGEEDTDYVENVDAREYSGFTRVAEIPRIEVVTTQPDNESWIELARINLESGVSAISNPVDPSQPGPNEIDRRHVIWAGSVGIAESRLATDDIDEISQHMLDTRRDFAALAARFPVISIADTRNAALTIDMLVRSDSLPLDRIADVIAVLAAVEQDAGQELGRDYPALVARSEFTVYQDAVAALLQALREGEQVQALITRQAAVAEAARELSEVIIKAPVANAGNDSLIETTQSEARATLDASASQAFGDHALTNFIWSKKN